MIRVLAIDLVFLEWKIGVVPLRKYGPVDRRRCDREASARLPSQRTARALPCFDKMTFFHS